MTEYALQMEAEAKRKAEESRVSAMLPRNSITVLPDMDRCTSREQSVHDRGNTLTDGRRSKNGIDSAAFKCNFCDGGGNGTCIGFRGICSDYMIRYNIEVRKCVWCSIGSECKRYYEGEISRAELDRYREPSGRYAACYESDLLDGWKMGAGVHHTGPDTGKPMHLSRMRKGNLAVMTTRKPKQKEEQRFVFAVWLVADAYNGDEDEEGYVDSDPNWRIELMLGQAEKILFWKYYFNKNQPDKIVFGSGLHPPCKHPDLHSVFA